MLEVTFSSLSSGASIDQQTGSLSVFDLIEEVRAPQVPFHLSSLVLVLGFSKNDGSHFSGQMLIHHVPPSGKPFRLGIGNLIVPSEKKKMKAVFRFGGFPITSFGRHRIVLSWVDEDGKKQGEQIFDFEAIHAPSPAQQGEHGNLGNGDPITH